MWKHGDTEVMERMRDVLGGGSHLFDELLQFCRAAVHVYVATAGGRRHGHHGAFAI